MQRLFRILFDIAIVLSLLLCLAMAALGVRSRFWWEDVVGWAGWKSEKDGDWQGWGIYSRGGRLTAYYFVGKLDVDDPTSIGGDVGVIRSKPHFFHHVSGASPVTSPAFRWETVNPGWLVPFEAKLVGAPFWFFAGLFAIGPVWRGFVIFRRWQRGRMAMGFEVCFEKSNCG